MTPDDRETADLRELLARRAAVSEAEVDKLRAFIATMPARRRQRRGFGMLAAAASVTVLLGVGLVAALGLSGGTTGAPPHAPNPAAFDGDPRLPVCHVTTADATAIFELAHLRDYAVQLPNAYPLVGLQADPAAPALVIVLNGPGTPQRGAETAAPGSHDLCLVVGADQAHWQQIAVVDVDTTGLQAFLPEPTGTPIASSLALWADRCGGAEAGILEVVLDTYAIGAPQSLPLDPRPPELDVAAEAAVPVAVIVYDTVNPFPPPVTPSPGEPTIAPREVPTGDHHDICVLVGRDPATAKRYIHENVLVTPPGEAATGLPSAAPLSSASASPSPSHSGSPAPSTALPSQISAGDCAALGFAPDRCLAVVEDARANADLAWGQIASVHLAKPVPTMSLGSAAIATVTFTLPDGTSVSPEVRCLFLGSQYSLVCTDHPEIRLSMPISGYYDVPCGAEPAGQSGSACATPLPTINPKAVSVPLQIAAQDFPLAVGHQELLVGQATLPDGVLKDARFSLADPTTRAFTVNGAVQLVIRSTDPSRPPFDNAYAHGWHPGSEVVNVSLVLDVASVQPGATLQIRDLVVR